MHVIGRRHGPRGLLNNTHALFCKLLGPKLERLDRDRLCVDIANEVSKDHGAIGFADLNSVVDDRRATKSCVEHQSDISSIHLCVDEHRRIVYNERVFKDRGLDLQGKKGERCNHGKGYTTNSPFRYDAG